METDEWDQTFLFGAQRNSAIPSNVISQLEICIQRGRVRKLDDGKITGRHGENGRRREKGLSTSFVCSLKDVQHREGFSSDLSQLKKKNRKRVRGAIVIVLLRLSSVELSKKKKKMNLLAPTERERIFGEREQTEAKDIL
jgi:hypothetical protein